MAIDRAWNCQEIELLKWLVTMHHPVTIVHMEEGWKKDNIVTQQPTTFYNSRKTLKSREKEEGSLHACIAFYPPCPFSIKPPFACNSPRLRP